MIKGVDPDYFPYKQEPDGTIVLVEHVETLVGTTPEGNLTLFLRGEAPTLNRTETYQCTIPADGARELCQAILDAVARLDDTAS